MYKKNFLFIFIVSCALMGCTSPRQMSLFSSGSSTAPLMDIPRYVITPGDVLKIEFTAVNMETVAPYNSAGTSYEVKDDGSIQMPVLGVVQIADKTADDAALFLEEMVRGKVNDPIVRLSITNAAVTVLGEVKSPSHLSAIQPITLLDALGRVGGLTKNAQCKDVVIQRREKGMIKQYHINLLTDELFSSPCYYLQKGDVVNVAPRYAR